MSRQWSIKNIILFVLLFSCWAFAGPTHLSPTSGKPKVVRPNMIIIDSNAGSHTDAFSKYTICPNFDSKITPEAISLFSDATSIFENLEKQNRTLEQQRLAQKVFEGELASLKVRDDEKYVKYFSEEERNRFKMTIKNGKFYNSSGQLTDTEAVPYKERAIYVQDSNGNFYIITDQDRKTFKPKSIQHSSFLGGQPVACAGELIIENGILKHISNTSGHYQPTIHQLERMQQFLDKQGVKEYTVERYTEKQFREVMSNAPKSKSESKQIRPRDVPLY